MNSVSVRLLVIWLVCAIAGTLAPFNFGTAADMDHGFKVFEYGAHGDPIHFVLNLLLFVPLGALLYHERRSRSATLLSIVIMAGLAGFSISMTVEYIQAFLPSRDSSLVDVLANTVGALIGVAAARRWEGPAEAHLGRIRAATSAPMLAGLIGSFLVVVLLISGTLQARTRLSNWNPDYPLLVGNEQTGDRPWRGRVFALDITDAATPAASVRRFSAGESVVLPGTPIATFVFDGNPPFQDRSGNLSSLESTASPNAAGQTGGLGRSWLRSERPASALAQRLRQTNAFTLRVQCATDDPNQDGPARIISNSVSPFLRNFTLGQEGSDLVFRLRTPDTGVNGYPLEVHVPGIFSDRRTRDILATYDGGTLLIAMANTAGVSRTELTPSTGVALAIPSLHVRAAELWVYELAYIAVVSLVPGTLIALLGQTGLQRKILSVAWVLASAVLLEATIAGVSGRSFDWPDVARAASVGAVVVTACNLVFSGLARGGPGRDAIVLAPASVKHWGLGTARRTTI